MLPLADDAGEMLSNSNNRLADISTTEPVAATDDTSSAHYSKLSYSASGGITHSVASENDYQ